jgi:hypothetical protein
MSRSVARPTVFDQSDPQPVSMGVADIFPSSCSTRMTYRCAPLQTPLWGRGWGYPDFAIVLGRQSG